MRKLRLILIYDLIAIHILLNISRSNGNQAIKFGKSIHYNERKSYRKEERRLVTDLFLFLKKTLYEVKASVQLFSFNIF